MKRESIVLYDDTPAVKGLTFGGRVQGWLADPTVQALIYIVVVSAIFLAIPALDIWFSGLFAAPEGGFPVGTLAFFKFLRAINQWASAIIPAALVILLIVKVAWPDRLSIVPPNKSLFILASEALGPGIVANLIFKSFWGRPRPNDVSLFGPGDLTYVPPWVISDQCPANCSFISGEGASAIWLLSLAVLVPLAWRPTALKALAALAIMVSLNRVAFGGHYLSDVMIAWGITALIMLVLYRYIFERPLPWVENAHLEAELTRLGIWIRRRLGFPTLAVEPAGVTEITPAAADITPPPPSVSLRPEAEELSLDAEADEPPARPLAEREPPPGR